MDDSEEGEFRRQEQVERKYFFGENKSFSPSTRRNRAHLIDREKTCISMRILYH